MANDGWANGKSCKRLYGDTKGVAIETKCRFRFIRLDAGDNAPAFFFAILRIVTMQY